MPQASGAESNKQEGNPLHAKVFNSAVPDNQPALKTDTLLFPPLKHKSQMRKENAYALQKLFPIRSCAKSTAEIHSKSQWKGTCTSQTVASSKHPIRYATKKNHDFQEASYKARLSWGF